MFLMCEIFYCLSYENQVIIVEKINITLRNINEFIYIICYLLFK